MELSHYMAYGGLHLHRADLCGMVFWWVGINNPHIQQFPKVVRFHLRGLKDYWIRYINTSAWGFASKRFSDDLDRDGCKVYEHV